MERYYRGTQSWFPLEGGAVLVLGWGMTSHLDVFEVRFEGNFKHPKLVPAGRWSGTTVAIRALIIGLSSEMGSVTTRALCIDNKSAAYDLVSICNSFRSSCIFSFFLSLLAKHKHLHFSFAKKYQNANALCISSYIIFFM
jgi:hypothetical protein